MFKDPVLSVMKRPEKDLCGKWGIYSEARGRWLDVVFSTEREASEAANILNKQGSKLGLMRG